MLHLHAVYDPESKNLVFEFSNSLLQDHFNLLEKSIDSNKDKGVIPKGVSIVRTGDTKCLINFPMVVLEGSSGIVPNEVVDKISVFLNEFRSKAIELEFKSTEFIPLNGYPLKDLKNDIVEAVKNKRNFYLVNEYSEYLRFSKGHTTKLKLFKAMYPTNEYSEIALYIHEGNLKKLRSDYLGKLEEFDWG